jgi:hypothetical protein
MTWFKKFENVLWIDNDLILAQNIINNLWKI